VSATSGAVTEGCRGSWRGRGAGVAPCNVAETPEAPYTELDQAPCFIARSLFQGCQTWPGLDVSLVAFPP